MRRKQARHVLVLIVVLLCAGLAGTPSANAEAATSFEIGSFVTSLSTTQAGSHPDVTTAITQANEALGNPVQQLKDVHIQLPPGLVGNPRAAPQCTARQFQSLKCPLDTQVGVIEPLFIIACRGVSTPLGAGLAGQVPPTVLNEPVSLGASTLTVESTAGIQVGDILTIGTGESTAEATVSAVTDPTHVELSFPINATFTAGTRVADDAIGVASTAGFCAGEHDQITVGTGAGAETATISFVASPTRLMLQAPLTQQHAAGEPVSHIAETQTAPFPLYNLEPTTGHLATLGMSFLIGSIFVQLDIRDDGSDGLDASITDLSTLFGLDGSSFTLWGVPADSSHNSERCTFLTHECGPATVEAKPFVTAPTQCSQPLTTTVLIDSWQNPGQFATASSSDPTPTGCERLQIAPTLAVAPDTAQADSPAGYTIALRLPQSEDAFGLATPALKTVAITLPAGASLSPAGTAGLQGCARVLFEAGTCPGSSALGAASISSPASALPLEGSVYLAAPEPGAPYGIFLIASAEGVSVRLEGRIRADPSTGQLTITFENSPQLPLSELRASFFGGPAAPLTNPPTCGNAIATSQISSYAGQTAEPSSSFIVAANNQGAACSSTRPFHPRFSAGMTSPLAGAFSPFTLTVAREDQEQDLSTITTQLPPGLLGQFSHVPLCAEPQAGEGRCSAASAVGSMQVGVGAGSDPLYLSGTVYLTGPYAAAPFGLSIVVPAVAGPFNLGTIVLRATVSVDPRDLHLKVVTDPIPQIVAGIPLRVRAIDLALDRPNFLFNPTNCAQQSISGILSSAEGANTSVSTSFALAGCPGLRFSPRLTASQHARTSAGGADLDVTISAGSGHQADIRSVAMRLPRQVRPRLAAVQHACRVALFNLSPKRCPSGSVIGHSAMTTPVLSAPLKGSLYIVSRGGSSPPVIAAMLSSGGIDVSLEGVLRLSNNGVTTVTFPALPDVPISSVKLSLPRGPGSALGTVHSLCSGVRPNISYRLTAQNGARQTRTIGVTVKGCPRGRRAVRASRRVSRRGRSQGRRALPRR
jgi:hypothetical protein